jgi:hypothetical protein
MVYVIIVVVLATPLRNASLGDFLSLKVFINGSQKATMLALTHLDPMKIGYQLLSFDVVG